MDNPLVTSWIVTGIGMLMLFLALAILYGLMVLMTGVIRERGTGTREQGPGARGQGAGREERETRFFPKNLVSGGQEAGEEGLEVAGARRRAAVIGVALARAESELSTVGMVGAEEPVSAWRALHHQRRLTLTPPRR